MPKIIKRTEVESFLAKIRTRYPCGLRNRAAFELMYRAGLRIGEVCDLHVRDIDFESGYVYVQQGKYSKDRVVPLDGATILWLTRWAARRPDSEYFFCTLAGNKIDQRQLRNVSYRVSEESGIYINDNHTKKLVTPHTLRHCYATELIEEGFTVPQVQKLLGHSRIETTMVYVSVRPEELAKKIRERVRAVPKQANTINGHE